MRYSNTDHKILLQHERVLAEMEGSGTKGTPGSLVLGRHASAPTFPILWSVPVGEIHFPDCESHIQTLVGLQDSPLGYHYCTLHSRSYTHRKHM
jgi:hypothetical protein